MVSLCTEHFADVRLDGRCCAKTITASDDKHSVDRLGPVGVCSRFTSGDATNNMGHWRSRVSYTAGRHPTRHPGPVYAEGRMLDSVVPSPFDTFPKLSSASDPGERRGSHTPTYSMALPVLRRLYSLVFFNILLILTES
jgi:hypothetical protein